MLESIIYDLMFSTGSFLADGLATYYGVSKLGIHAEANIEAREGMLREGVGKYLIKDTLSSIPRYGIMGIVFFGLDCELGVEESILNFHHVYLYGIVGGIKYSAALTNVLHGAGIKRLARIVDAPSRLFLKLVKPINPSTYDDI